MDMGAGAVAGTALIADILAFRDALADADGDALHVPVDGDEAVAVVDVDGIAEAVRGPPGKDDPSGLRGGEMRTGFVAMSMPLWEPKTEVIVPVSGQTKPGLRPLQLYDCAG